MTSESLHERTLSRLSQIRTRDAISYDSDDGRGGVGDCVGGCADRHDRDSTSVCDHDYHDGIGDCFGEEIDHRDIIGDCVG